MSGLRSCATVVAGPWLRPGSSVATTGIGDGLKKPPCVGSLGSAILMACTPPECQLIIASFRSTVGLCEEKLRNRSATEVSAGLPQNDSWSWSMRYSPVMNGCAGSLTSTILAQPHLQPKAEKVKVP